MFERGFFSSPLPFLRSERKGVSNSPLSAYALSDAELLDLLVAWGEKPFRARHRDRRKSVDLLRMGETCPRSHHDGSDAFVRSV